MDLAVSKIIQQHLFLTFMCFANVTYVPLNVSGI